ncbi:site-specific DNA-methyltransferase [Enterococcus sp. PF-2]|uniref:DNA adenine methylase n=1 Tax=unclassified Enterococcus TaxID=2608891 RepID=UPI001121F807|nr:MULTISPECIES: DNA adenine methylase [unclassified Enterococcus]TPE00965.1 site-specific DNA-methyltransferase [Enterococcus sp. PF-3]TPE24517.1 site-specific DNA-methyltransferase [Enterococcus sp. PF-2]
MYIYKDYTEYYGRVMQFGKNKKVPIHRWYPFVEGYSREFIQSIIAEQEAKPKSCLEPFSGSGTTALELQAMGIRCYSFEVNPFMYTLSRAKLKANSYSVETVRKHLRKMKKSIKSIDDSKVSDNTEFPTLIEDENKNKWNLDKPVFIAVEKIMIAINELNSHKYRELYIIAVANVLLEYGNLYRNGKCLSYKKGWREKKSTKEEAIEFFFNFVEKIMIKDLKGVSTAQIENEHYLFEGDSRKLILEKIEDSSIDLVITSPPYLNSRDYTDSYMLELKALGYLTSHKEIRDLRTKTLRSHVQIKLDNIFDLDNEYLNNTVKELEIARESKSSWNDEIILMVRAYFEDIKQIFEGLYAKVKKGKKVYFNVSNSAYYGVLINTLEICSSIAEQVGFVVEEIREARYLKSSPQQKELVGNLLEGVIVLRR